ncbi:DAK2 domain-containing protein [Intrasporangium sp.]|uniref:DAK2 domain-containing protein n=1 Tax=Intrasporangium sp. TaxID=1925024 RepID=UPI00293AE5D5|nr:DAK2 domain-containing protein [Intrasporangium sp.]MDV3221507.1 DAK2 domain-containing protein [Intrasporangium sp.]
MTSGSLSPVGALEALDVNAVRRWAVLVRSVLAARRAEIDALNVFPVPDGDTGTNLYLTFDAALDRMLAQDAGQPPPDSVGHLLKGFAGHLLWTARGNSGVILSQLVRGLAEGIADSPVIAARELAAGLVKADERAWQGVTDPKEGTILSVSRAAALASGEGDDRGLHPLTVRVLAAAQEALARTPEQLPVLARAGVVDAGGAGLVLILECLERLAAGDDGRVVLGLSSSDRRGRFHVEPGAPLVTRPLDADVVPMGEAPGPEYEVMYLLAVEDEDRIPDLRSRLAALGDSVLVVGGDGEWNVHAHVDDPGAAVEAGIDTGRPHRVRITRLLPDEGAAYPVHGHGGEPAHGAALGAGDDAATPGADAVSKAGSGTVSAGGAEGSTGAAGSAGSAGARGTDATGIVACAAGAGLAAVFEEAGAIALPSGPGHRATTGQFIEAIRQQHATGVRGVIVLPNDTDTELAAAAAARAVADEGIEALVVRARTAVQGVAAAAVFEAAAAPSTNLVAMQSAASGTRHGAVTIANRVGLTSGGPCEPGDVLGVVDGDIVIVGSDQLAVAREVVHRLLSSGGEMVTVVLGDSAPEGLVPAIEATVRAAHRGVEVGVLDGGQPVYTALIGVE